MRFAFELSEEDIVNVLAKYIAQQTGQDFPTIVDCLEFSQNRELGEFVAKVNFEVAEKKDVGVKGGRG